MITGKCHCEAVTWTYSVPIESATACNCTLCRRYGALWAYGHLSDGIAISGPTKSYERGRKLNGYHFCTNCGCLCYYLSNSLNSEKKRRIAVNLRMANEVGQIENLPIDHFDGLDKFEDQPRDGKLVKDLLY